MITPSASELDSERDFLNAVEVSRRLGISTQRVYDLIRSGDLPACRLGGRLYVPKNAWDYFVEVKSREAILAAEEKRSITQ